MNRLPRPADRAAIGQTPSQIHQHELPNLADVASDMWNHVTSSSRLRTASRVIRAADHGPGASQFGDDDGPGRCGLARFRFLDTGIGATPRIDLISRPPRSDNPLPLDIASGLTRALVVAPVHLMN